MFQQDGSSEADINFVQREYRICLHFSTQFNLLPPLPLLEGGDDDGVVVALVHAPLVAGQRAQRDVRDGEVVPLLEVRVLVHYRVTHLVIENLPLTWVLVVPSSCLGSK